MPSWPLAVYLLSQIAALGCEWLFNQPDTGVFGVCMQCIVAGLVTSCVVHELKLTASTHSAIVSTNCMYRHATIMGL